MKNNMENKKFFLYARKSTDVEDKQVLSIDAQLTELREYAVRENIEISAEIVEKQSAKVPGRPLFNKMMKEIETFGGNILAWNPDRLARNSVDGGQIIYLLDTGKLASIKFPTFWCDNTGQGKFMLNMAFGQSKYFVDNLRENVKRGLRTRVEMGLWPGMAPLGYTDQNLMDKKGQKLLDSVRAPIVKQMFEKVAYDKWSGRKLYNWLKHDLNFKTRGNKTLTLGGVYRVLDNPFYYGKFERPRESGNWYDGKHKPIITKELFDLGQTQLKRDQIVRENKEFAFTKLFTCGLCQSGISAEDKYKKLRDGTTAHYIYYGCCRSKDRNCKNKYIREEELIDELLKIIDQVNINELGMRQKLEDEIRRFNKLQKIVNGQTGKALVEENDVNIRQYAKYLLKEGSVSDKRELLANLRSRLNYKDKKITLIEEA